MKAETEEALKRYLLSHEQDIFHEINDFGELIDVFVEIIGHLPKG